MKYLKMLGLAAIAALSLMAFAGAGTASATTLCTTTDTPDCSMPYVTGTTIDGSLIGTARLTDSNSNTLITCSSGTVKGKTSNETGTAVSGNIEELTWGGCSSTADTVKKGKLKIEWISGTHNGTITGEESEVTVSILGVTCTYGTGAGTHLGTLVGGESPTIVISTTVTKTAGGILCPGTAGWDAEYTVTAPHALYVTT